MMEGTGPLQELALRVKLALENGDIDALSDLLDPDVTWGPPGDPSPPCQNRRQVLAWYEKGKKAGARAQVREVSTLGGRILVGLLVSDPRGAEQEGGGFDRWQVLTVHDGRVTDIVGFDQRADAVAWAEGAKS